ncbi:hypothetical protein EDD21DRAFT_99097 [Dissophora ornata]|nr:hypothetical protein BGZ58_004451 [Dissophora ornata]KAI8601755.1 hypothetical protein EDD21DRAFT_99097 [Dissophora ornata]
MPPRERCCWCFPFRFATILGGLLLAAFGAAGCYLYFTNTDLPKRTITVDGQTMSPLTSSQTLWYYMVAVSVLAAAVGVFGMLSALFANRRAVKAFEAFYVLSLLTQLGLVIWASIWCKQNQDNFDTVCAASKAGLVDLPIPGFASGWSCQQTFTAGILTLAIGGMFWICFNFYMTNRVIHYARELFTGKADLYKVLGEAATKELDREQQIPLNYTNIGASRGDQDGYNSHLQQPAYRDEPEYKDPRGGDDYQHSREAAAGFGPYGNDLPQQYQHEHQQYPVAPGFSHHDSTHGIDLVNPYYGEQETIPGSIDTETTQIQHSHPSATPYHAPGSGQSFVHASTSNITSPFDEEAPITPTQLFVDDIKVPLPSSPTGTLASSNVLAPTPVVHNTALGNNIGSSGSSGNREPYQF